LLTENGRDAFIESYARETEKNPLHSALSLSLLYGLQGDNDKARECLLHAKELCAEGDWRRKEIDGLIAGLGGAEYVLSIVEASQTVYEVQQGVARISPGTSCSTYQRASLRVSPAGAEDGMFKCRALFKGPFAMKASDPDSGDRVTKTAAETSIDMDRGVWSSSMGLGVAEFLAQGESKRFNFPLQDVAVTVTSQAVEPTKHTITIDYSIPKGSRITLWFRDGMKAKSADTPDIRQYGDRFLEFETSGESTGRYTITLTTPDPLQYYIPRMSLLLPVAKEPKAPATDGADAPGKEITGAIGNIAYTLTADATMSVRERIQREEIVILIPEASK